MDIKCRRWEVAEPNDGYADIDIPSELLITNFDDPIQAIVQSTYQTSLRFTRIQFFYNLELFWMDYSRLLMLSTNIFWA